MTSIWQKIQFVLATMLFAFQVNAQQSPTFMPDGKAIHGYDPVAFFVDGKALEGKDQFYYTWDGGTWYFTTEAHLDSFKANPTKYAPQFGGYCAYGASKGYKAPTEISTWTIVDNKLYFNYNNQVKRVWNQRKEDFIPLAEKQWATVRVQ